MTNPHHAHAGRSAHRCIARGLAGGAIVLLLAFAPAGRAANLSVEPGQTTTEWTVKHGGQRVLVYALDPARHKPYVKELATVSGFNILRDSPFDHLHHHSLMFAIKVNGVNFWEETEGCGVQKPVRTEAPQIETTAAGPRAVLRQTLHWLPPQDAFLHDTARAALLVEERTLVLQVDEAAGEVALHWKSAFTVGARTNQVTLTGANYHGLGMRFLQELDPVAKHLNAGGAPNLDGRQDVSVHKWGSVGFDLPGRQATVVLFGHPSNARGDAAYFTMSKPFAYLSATQLLDKEPLVYRAGDRWQLNYLVTVYPALKTSADIQARAKRWESPQP
jgi:hypothetical protein